jgi:CRISPR-associated protein Csy3
VSDIKVASVLAFERKLDPSDALFFGGNWENRKNSKNWTPIIINEKVVRGTISNRLKTKEKDPSKPDTEVEKPNLQKIDIAALPHDCNTLKFCFTLKVLEGVGFPSACNNIGYQEKLLKIVKDYISQNGLKELATRFAYNLANGRFLWRNRIGAEEIEICIYSRQDGNKELSWRFNTLDYTLQSFKLSTTTKDNVESLSQIIEAGLKGETYVFLRIEAYVKIGEGQEVHPSQELILDTHASKKGKKSRTLYQVNGIAAMHSQKIGNALRTIDTWYSEESDLKPIAIEPYGSVTTLRKAFRQPENKKDFYTLFDNWIIKDLIPEINHQHFVIAILIRGGVFGASAKE